MEMRQISVSKITTLEKCGMQAYFRYGEGLKLPPSIAMLRGRALDTPVDLDLRRKMETGELAGEDELRDTAATAVTRAFDQEDEVAPDPDYEGLAMREARDTLSNEVQALALHHHQRVAPTIHPVDLQVRWEVEPSEALPAKFVGVLDIVDQQPGGFGAGGPVIRDTKSKRKAPNSDDAEDSLQLSAYDLLHRARYGRPSAAQTLDYLWRTPGGKLGYKPLTTTRSLDDLSAFVARANRALEAFRAEVFVPAPEDSWVCSKRWCGYHPDNGGPCPFARRRSRPRS